MTNSFYNVSGIPTYRSTATSSSIRTEFASIDAGFVIVEAHLALKANLSGGNTFTGTQTMTAALASASTAVTQAALDSSTKIANTAWTQGELALKANLAGGNTFTGTQTMTAILSSASIAVTASALDSSTKIATTAWTQAELLLKASLSGGNTFTGTQSMTADLGNGSTAVTQLSSDSSTKISTTAFVQAVAFTTALPAQATNAGKLVTTDGSNASWTNSLSIGLNEAMATVASHATTADIWAALGNQINWTGTATTTIFPNAPQAGAKRTLICAGACSFTASTNMLIDGYNSGDTMNCATNDQVCVIAISTTQFKLTRVRSDGAPTRSVINGRFFYAMGA